MQAGGWAGAELANGRLRLWQMGGDAGGTPLVSVVNGDPAQALRAMLHPLLEPGRAMTVIAAGWPGVRPVPVPCRPPVPLAGQAIDPRIILRPLPSLAQGRPADLLASAVSIAGHLARRPDEDGVLCLPGSSTVWAQLSAGEIVSFRSFLTAELLTAVAPQDDRSDPVRDGFADAVHQAMSRPAGLAGDLSSVRARLAMGLLDPPAGHAQAAGLLIGAELAAARPWWLGQTVTVIGGDRLAEGYVQALAAQGVVPRRADPVRALLDGFRAAHSVP